VRRPPQVHFSRAKTRDPPSAPSSKAFPADPGSRRSASGKNAFVAERRTPVFPPHKWGRKKPPPFPLPRERVAEGRVRGKARSLGADPPHPSLRDTFSPGRRKAAQRIAPRRVREKWGGKAGDHTPRQSNAPSALWAINPLPGDRRIRFFSSRGLPAKRRLLRP
jgi:hypothetical protein